MLTSIEHHRGRAEIGLRTDEGSTLTVPSALFADGLIQHGYACTIHKAQGQTVDIALVHATGGLSAEAGYVALSRARTATHLYTSRPAGPGLGDDGGTGRTATIDLADQLRRRRAHTLAIDQHRRYLDHDAAPDRSRGLGR